MLFRSRQRSEEYFLNRFDEDKKLLFFSVGGDSRLDKKFKKEWGSRFRQINTGQDYGLGNNRYLNVFGDFIFLVTTDGGFGEGLDSIYSEHEDIDSKMSHELAVLAQAPHKTKLVFMRNKKKADEWRRRFLKDFYIPRDLSN
mgnify:CR=1 FL=1